jgi:excisionase family DNA binding protein
MKSIIEKQIEEIHMMLSKQDLLYKSHFTLKEAAIYLGISESFLYKLTSNNEITFYRPGCKLIYFQKADLDNCIYSKKEASKSEILNSHLKVAR